MARHDYHVRTTWDVEAGLDEIAAILRAPAALARWWPAAFLDVEERPGAAGGSAGRVRSKGWLPYTLSFDFAVAERPDAPAAVVRVTGDFEGRCVVTVAPRGPRLAIEFDWRVSVRKPVIRRWSWLLRRVFIANHRWVMARGLESLQLELARRRDAAELGRPPVPLPPGPTFPYGPRYRRLRRLAARLVPARPRWRGAAAFGQETGG